MVARKLRNWTHKAPVSTYQIFIKTYRVPDYIIVISYIALSRAHSENVHVNFTLYIVTVVIIESIINNIAKQQPTMISKGKAKRIVQP